MQTGFNLCKIVRASQRKDTMTKENEMRLISKFEDQILELIDNQEDYTRSDLQGVVQAIVMNIIRENK